MGVRALLLGAVALEVMNPAHTRVLGDEAVDRLLGHEVRRLCLAPANLTAAPLRLLELLLERLLSALYSSEEEPASSLPRERSMTTSRKR